jgi:hypothetical protein
MEKLDYYLINTVYCILGVYGSLETVNLNLSISCVICQLVVIGVIVINHSLTFKINCAFFFFKRKNPTFYKTFLKRNLKLFIFCESV